MIDADTLLSVMAIAQQLFDRNSEDRLRAGAEARHGLERLGTAVDATSLYIRRRRSGSPRSEQKEDELSLLWDSAGRALQPTYPELALRCRFKGRYWSDPARWTNDQIDGLNIRLTTMSTELNQLLRKPA